VNIYRLLARQAELCPEAIALGAPGRPSLTYARLRTRVEEVVATLNGLGIGRNDRVSIVLPNGPEMAVAFLGAASGAAAAPLNPTYRAAEFDFYLSDLGAKALIVPFRLRFSGDRRRGGAWHPDHRALGGSPVRSGSVQPYRQRRCGPRGQGRIRGAG